MRCWGAGVTEAALPDAGRRGRLDIADRVIERIAEHATTSVVGVVQTGSTIDKFVGRRLPRVTSNVRGDQARVGVEIAVVWPRSLSEVARAVQTTVQRQVTSLSGLKVVAVDVSVIRVEQPQTAPTRRVE